MFFLHNKTKLINTVKLVEIATTTSFSTTSLVNFIFCKYNTNIIFIINHSFSYNLNAFSSCFSPHMDMKYSSSGIRIEKRKSSHTSYWTINNIVNNFFISLPRHRALQRCLHRHGRGVPRVWRILLSLCIFNVFTAGVPPRHAPGSNCTPSALRTTRVCGLVKRKIYS